MVDLTRRPASSTRRGFGATIIDVARRAGVSPMTVSRVVNKENNVRPDTQKMVERAIADLGYEPNAAARLLAGVKLPKIALLHDNPSSGYMAELLLGVVQQASKVNAHFIVQEVGSEATEVDVIRSLASAGVDGLILSSPLCEDRRVADALQETGLFAVAVASSVTHKRQGAVSIDNYSAAREMTAYLLRLGHCRIGFVEGSPRQVASGRRRDGYRDEMVAAGLDVDETLIASGHFTYRSGLEAAEKLLASDHRPTAIFASNDDMAAAAIAVAQRLGLRVPDDLTVCGFDDTAVASVIWPQLTTIRQPIADMARAAVDLLVDAIRARDGSRILQRSPRFEFQLVERQSAGKPASR
jgi:LacI family transcriptional regulator